MAARAAGQVPLHRVLLGWAKRPLEVVGDEFDDFSAAEHRELSGVPEFRYITTRSVALTGAD